MKRLILLCLFASVLAFNPALYKNSTELIPDTYWLYWSVDTTNEEVHFATRVRTTGWVGLGISVSGGMIGSDVVVGWINAAGEVIFHDRFITQKGPDPAIDPHQDWTLIRGEQTSGANPETILEFKRKFKSCDYENDVDILPGTTRVIYSYSDIKPTNNVNLGSQHIAKGTAFITFYGASPAPAPPEPVADTFELLAPNVEIPTSDTTYMCVFFQLPVTEDVHIIEYEPSTLAILNSSAYNMTVLDNVERVHHFLLYDCLTPPNVTSQHADDCDNLQDHQCFVVSYGWAVGGGKYILPKDLGVPIGPSSTTWVMLQIHYDNPQGLRGERDSSGIKFTYTNQLRTHDVGMFMTGRAEIGIAIPPGLKNFETTGDCTSECTSNLIPAGGINVISALLHTHLLGRKLWTQIIRNGTELEPLLKIDHYDFNFQEFILFDTPRVLHPGDRIVTHCNYDSTSRTQVTPGGRGTRQEMCYTFFHYYPRVPFSYCVEGTRPDGTNSGLQCAFDKIPVETPAPFTPLQPNYPVCPPDEQTTEGDSSVGSRQIMNSVATLLLLALYMF